VDTSQCPLQGDAAAKFFAPGKWIGAYVQAGPPRAIRHRPVPLFPTLTTANQQGISLVSTCSRCVSQTFTQAIKHTVRRDRPTGECCAFPSGHASAAFASASVIERHFGYRGSWPMFAIATYVATSRLSENRHFLSDVIFGASLGMASGWTVVGRHGRPLTP
jgi:membrane-associated phospholipid phosphatase